MILFQEGASFLHEFHQMIRVHEIVRISFTLVSANEVD